MSRLINTGRIQIQVARKLRLTQTCLAKEKKKIGLNEATTVKLFSSSLIPPTYVLIKQTGLIPGEMTFIAAICAHCVFLNVPNPLLKYIDREIRGLYSRSPSIARFLGISSVISVTLLMILHSLKYRGAIDITEGDDSAATIGDQPVENLLNDSEAFVSYLNLKKMANEDYMNFTTEERASFIERIRKREFGGFGKVSSESSEIIADNISAYGKALIVSDYIQVENLLKESTDSSSDETKNMVGDAIRQVNRKYEDFIV